MEEPKHTSAETEGIPRARPCGNAQVDVVFRDEGQDLLASHLTKPGREFTSVAHDAKTVDMRQRSHSDVASATSRSSGCRGAEGDERGFGLPEPSRTFTSTCNARRGKQPTMATGQTHRCSYRRLVLNGDAELTPWEVRVLRLVADGWTNARLSRRFGRSVGLFEQTRTSIYRKLGAVNAPHAVTLAYERGLLSAPRRR